MSRLQILPKNEQRKYESPPRIKGSDKLTVFTLPSELQKKARLLRAIGSNGTKSYVKPQIIIQ